MTDEPSLPAEAAPADMVPGSLIKLADDRSVFLGQVDGIYMIRFTNGDRVTRLAVSGEALDALVHLALAREGVVVA
jgi:hypothetical protein